MSAPLVAPGRGQGLRDVVRHWYLLRLIVRKEVQVRYRGSVLGIVWSYIKPAVQFAVFYVAMGVFLGLNGVVLKSHGSADAKGVANCVHLCAELIEKDITRQVTDDLANFQSGNAA